MIPPLMNKGPLIVRPRRVPVLEQLFADGEDGVFLEPLVGEYSPAFAFQDGGDGVWLEPEVGE